MTSPLIVPTKVAALPPARLAYFASSGLSQAGKATLGGRKPLRSADLISLPLGPANLAHAIFHLAAHTLWDQTDNLVSEGTHWHLGISS